MVVFFKKNFIVVEKIHESIEKCPNWRKNTKMGTFRPEKRLFVCLNKEKIEGVPLMYQEVFRKTFVKVC